MIDNKADSFLKENILLNNFFIHLTDLNYNNFLYQFRLLLFSSKLKFNNYEYNASLLEFNYDFENNFDKENINYLTKLFSYKKNIENNILDDYSNIFSEKQLKKLFLLNNIDKKINFIKSKLNREIYKKIKKILNSKNISRLKTNTKNNIIDVINGHKFFCSKYENEYILKDINLSIRQGSFAIIIGSSGSGKTTLLNILAGIDKFTIGTTIVNNTNLSILDDKSLTKFRFDNTSYIFQSYGLIGNLTVEENVLLGYKLGGINDSLNNFMKIKWNYNDEKRIWADKIIKDLDLYTIKNETPYKLSGGQKQKVAIARSIIKSPSIIFADEPTSALDLESKKKVINLFQKINQKLGITIVMVTHDEDMKKIASDIIKISDGRIIEIIRK